MNYGFCPMQKEVMNLFEIIGIRADQFKHDKLGGKWVKKCLKHHKLSMKKDDFNCSKGQHLEAICYI